MGLDAGGAGRRTIDVAEVIGRQRLGGFVVSLVAISCIITFFDGLDMLVISFLARYIRDELGLDQNQLGYLFSTGVFGAMVGGFWFGWLGDRMGRRPAILISVLGFGVTALALAFCTSFWTLLPVRFLNGIALGGLLPLAWALNVEFVPSRFRATVVTVIMMGYTVGGAVAGPMTEWIAPLYGWQAVFLICGVVTLAMLAVLYFTLPESARYLAIKGRSPDQIAAALNRMDRTLGATANDLFIVSDEKTVDKSAKKASPIGELFKGRLVAITPLLWLAYIFSSAAIFFKANWGPLVLESVGLTSGEAAYVSSASSIAGALAGLGLMRFTDRYGVIAIAALPLLAAPLLFVMGVADVGRNGFVLLSILSMSMVGGMHFGMHSVAGIFYPSAVRANGGGWATSVAKIGAVAAPMIGGWVMAAGLPPRQTFIFLALAPLITAVTLLVLSRVAKAKADPEPESAGEPALT